MSNRWLLYVLRFVPQCRDIMGLVSRSLDQPLSRRERITLRVHMLHCPACNRSSRQIRLLVATLRRFARLRSGDGSGAIPGLPAEVRERIKQALRKE